MLVCNSSDAEYLQAVIVFGFQTKQGKAFGFNIVIFSVLRFHITNPYQNAHQLSRSKIDRWWYFKTVINLFRRKTVLNHLAIPLNWYTIILRSESIVFEVNVKLIHSRLKVNGNLDFYMKVPNKKYDVYTKSSITELHNIFTRNISGII